MLFESLLASHTSSNILQLQFQPQNSKKGGMCIYKYLLKRKDLADKLATAGEPIDGIKLLLYILNGLGAEYNAFVTSFLTQLVPMALTELRILLLSFENRLEQQNVVTTLDLGQPLTNVAVN